jgi:hypothetical protein
MSSFYLLIRITKIARFHLLIPFLICIKLDIACAIVLSVCIYLTMA